jgi:inner membrane protein
MRSSGAVFKRANLRAKNMSWWIWVLAGLLLLAIEFASTTMHLGLFAIGAFVVAVLMAFGLELPLWSQILIFTGVSVFSLLFIRPILVRKLKLHETKQVDTLIGEQALALDDIDVAAIGKAEMRGSTWNARNIGETALIRGQRCIVAQVDGLELHVKAS